MKLKNHLAATNLTNVLTTTLTKKVIDIVQGLSGQLEELYTNKVYTAISSGVIDGTPESLGVVRFSCSYFSPIEYTEGYIYAIKTGTDVGKYEPFIHKPAQLQLVVDIPLIGQIGATVNNINPKSGKFDRSDVNVRIAGPEGTLWFEESDKILDSLPGLIKLTTATVSFTLEDM